MKRLKSSAESPLSMHTLAAVHTSPPYTSAMIGGFFLLLMIRCPSNRTLVRQMFASSMEPKGRSQMPPIRNTFHWIRLARTLLHTEAAVGPP
mmetsp:Transcript_80304/g.215240  ORF Transcript_80304/g.215240 Transcript_80304/m.215240 type:complete len:92 (-) Transcript_80304:474-749(-)